MRPGDSGAAVTDNATQNKIIDPECQNHAATIQNPTAKTATIAGVLCVVCMEGVSDGVSVISSSACKALNLMILMSCLGKPTSAAGVIGHGPKPGNGSHQTWPELRVV